MCVAYRLLPPQVCRNEHCDNISERQEQRIALYGDSTRWYHYEGCASWNLYRATENDLKGLDYSDAYCDNQSAIYVHEGDTALPKVIPPLCDACSPVRAALEALSRCRGWQTVLDPSRPIAEDEYNASTREQPQYDVSGRSGYGQPAYTRSAGAPDEEGSPAGPSNHPGARLSNSPRDYEAGEVLEGMHKRSLQDYASIHGSRQGSRRGTPNRQEPGYSADDPLPQSYNDRYSPTQHETSEEQSGMWEQPGAGRKRAADSPVDEGRRRPRRR